MTVFKLSLHEELQADFEELRIAGQDVTGEAAALFDLLRRSKTADVPGHHHLKGELSGWCAELGDQAGDTGPRIGMARTLPQLINRV